MTAAGPVGNVTIVRSHPLHLRIRVPFVLVQFPMSPADGGGAVLWLSRYQAEKLCGQVAEALFDLSELDDDAAGEPEATL